MSHDLRLSRSFIANLMSRIRDHVSLLRPSHWVKSLIAVPIGPATMVSSANPLTIFTLAGAILMFSLASAAVYVLNDLLDIERDRLHPSKRTRPLASGAVKPTTAICMLAGLGAGLLFAAAVLPLSLSVMVTLYLGCNIAYSIWLKHVPIVEMLIVAVGFALRTCAGYLAFGAHPDPWVIATVLAGSLLMTVGKRRDELRRVRHYSEHRPVLAHYSEPLLDAYLLIAAICCLGTSHAAMIQFFDAAELRVLFFISTPFAVYLIQRYLLLAFAGTGASNPTRLLLSDRAIQLVLIIWASTLGAAVILSHTDGFDQLFTLARAQAAP